MTQNLFLLAFNVVEEVCAAMDALHQWMGAVRTRADKNITIIHSPSVNIWRRQKLKQTQH